MLKGILKVRLLPFNHKNPNLIFLMYSSLLMTVLVLININYNITYAEEVYENKDLGVKFTIPEKFEVIESELNKVVLSPKNTLDSIYYEILIESIENNDGEDLKKWLKDYLKDNYRDEDKFRIDMALKGEPGTMNFSNDRYKGYFLHILDRDNHTYNSHSFVYVNNKIYHLVYSAPTPTPEFTKYYNEINNIERSIEFIK